MSHEQWWFSIVMLVYQRVRADMMQIWCRYDADMMQIWCRYGSKMDWKWIGNGLKLQVISKLKFHFLSAKHETYERQWLKIENVWNHQHGIQIWYTALWHCCTAALGRFCKSTLGLPNLPEFLLNMPYSQCFIRWISHIWDIYIYDIYIWWVCPTLMATGAKKQATWVAHWV